MTRPAARRCHLARLRLALASDDRQQDRIGKEPAADGMPPRNLAENLEVSVPTLYRWLPVSKRA